LLIICHPICLYAAYVLYKVPFPNVNGENYSVYEWSGVFNNCELFENAKGYDVYGYLN
jgi:hypothetical protein